ncbi:hypothetical protein HC62_08560 [Acetobacter tropicalis]|uniref:Uncharacterized protein n=1 Tax=Acetobacter tropicalis TaxID=104102 RepID=A0A252A889_9PROT|nr:hypothetical protein HC62_08560 [Acetobacter tropicalis]
MSVSARHETFDGQHLRMASQIISHPARSEIIGSGQPDQKQSAIHIDGNVLRALTAFLLAS